MNWWNAISLFSWGFVAGIWCAHFIAWLVFKKSENKR